MIPETKHEKENLDALWKALIRCDADSKVLCPIGSYIASQDEVLIFNTGPIVLLNMVIMSGLSLNTKNRGIRV